MTCDLSLVYNALKGRSGVKAILKAHFITPVSTASKRLFHLVCLGLLVRVRPLLKLLKQHKERNDVEEVEPRQGSWVCTALVSQVP